MDETQRQYAPNLRTLLIRLALICLLLISMVLAIVSPPQNFYPVIEVDSLEPANSMELQFLFDGSNSAAECERINGNIAQAVLKNCPHCRLRTIRCVSNLSHEMLNTLGTVPLSTPSGRMTNGVITFRSSLPNQALDACTAAQAQSRDTTNPIHCFPASTERPKPASHSALNLWVFTLFMIALGAAWLVGWLIVRYEHLHAHLSHDHVASGPQKYHTQPTPRIGGIAVMGGLLASGAIMLSVDTIATERQFGLLLIASLPAFLGGLIEDLTKRVGVLERLLLTMSAGAVAAWLLGTVLNRLDIPGVDAALHWLPLAIAFTAFAVGGIANSINIIDGYNGLTGGFAVIVLAAIAFVASNTGDILVFNTAISLAGAIVGFLLWNWPGGKIFFGDGGAYLIGFMLAELSVLLVMRNSEVSPWFPLLLLIYPIFETIYSVYRRKYQNNLSPGQPDNQHLHQLIHDKLIPHQNHGKRFSRNSKVAKYLWIPTGALAAFGSVFAESSPILASTALGFCVFYVVIYRRVAAKGVVKHA